MISDKTLGRINCDVLCSLNFRALKERSWQYGQCFMIKDVIMALEEERHLHINRVRINLEFLEILLVNTDPSCPCIDKHIVRRGKLSYLDYA